MFFRADSLVTDDRSHESRTRTRHDGFRHLFDRTRHRCAKHALLDSFLARREDLVRLFEKVEFEKFVGLVED